ncbi:MAG: extracellular solute-binding protein [Oscillospiraceae bacterium]|jgi:iron(III) transport system substrate-binding protein|nr:extracellular solute-binding protein [Oscillospiraceae bacterium]
MKKSARVLVFLLAVAMLISGASLAESKTTVTIYTARDTNVIEYVKPLFETAYPQYELEVLNMGAQEILERVRAEKVNPQGDFLWGGTEAAFKLAAQEGLLSAYTPSFAADFPAAYKDPNDLWYGEILLPEVIMYNTEALTEADLPKDWDDLLGEAYKDAFIIRGVLASGTMRTIYSCMIYASGGSDPEQGYEWLRKFDANTKEYAQNPTDMYLKIARQEGTLSLWNLQDIMIQKIVNEQPFGYVIPESGVPILVDAVGIISGAKNEEGAKAFYEFLFTPEIKLALAENMYQIPAQGDIPADKLPQWIQDLELKAMDIDWSVIAENEMTWMTYWDENIKGKN